MSSALFQVAVAVQDNAGDWVFLSEVSKVTPDVAPDQLTTMTIDCKADGHGAALLKMGGLVRAYYREADGFWKSPRNGTYRLAHKADDKINRKDVTWSARSLFGDFERAVLLQDPAFVPPVRELGEFTQHYPRTWPTGSTAGDVLATAILEAKARGELAGLDTSLVSRTTDSLGNPWSVGLPAEEHQTFTPLSTLVKSLTERGLVSVQFDGVKIMLLDPASVGTDRSAKVELMPSRDLTEAPTRTEADAAANRAYVKGDNATVEIVDMPGMNTSDVRAVALDAAGITDPAVLRQIGLLHLSTVNRQRMELTVGIDCWASKFVPWRDFDVDDVVTVAYGGGGTEAHKVRQITVEQNDKGVRASVVLGDRLPDPALEALRQLKSMRDGATRARGASGISPSPATAIRPGTPYAYEWPDGSRFRVGPDGFELTDPTGQPLLTNEGIPDWGLDDGGGGGDGTGGGGNVYSVQHGSNANMERPAGAGTVLWFGTVQPVNALRTDFIINI